MRFLPSLVIALAAGSIADHALGQTFSQFPLPEFTNPSDIAAGPDGAMWVTAPGQTLFRITVGGTVTEFPVPGPPDTFPGITAGPDGNLWFTQEGVSAIGRITPSGVVTQFPVPINRPGGSHPFGITAGPDGNIWFTEYYGNAIGRITPAGELTEFPLPSPETIGHGPRGITAGPDGNVWFTEIIGNAIGRITPSGEITEFFGAAGGPQGIVTGPDANLWFTPASSNSTADFGRILAESPNTIEEFALSPQAVKQSSDITVGADGNLYFCEAIRNNIVRVTLDDPPRLTEIPRTAPFSKLFGIAAGPDGNIWYAASDAYLVERLNITTPPPTDTATHAPTATPTPGLPTGTATKPPTPTAVAPATATAISFTPTAVSAPCVGDCNGAGGVTIDELLRGVNIALGSAPLDSCPAFDCHGTSNVTIDCLLRAVAGALGAAGCAS